MRCTCRCPYELQFTKLLLMSRDGVSEGQFYQVLLYELDAIRKVRIVIAVYIISQDCLSGTTK